MKEFKSFYKTVGGNEGDLCLYTTRLDTYGCGCQHDCAYCYAKSLLDFRGLWNANEPSVADVQKIKRKIARLEPGTVLRLGGMTDCFMPMEKEHRVTYETIQALNERGIHYLVVTKSPIVADDEYIELYDKSLAHFQVSITATGDDDAYMFERAARPSLRIKALEKLAALGFDTTLRLSPLIPQFVDFDVINAAQVEKCLVEFLRGNAFVRRTFDIDWSDYDLKIGNYWHLPLEKKLEQLAKITLPQISVCDDVPEHYAYFKENFNANSNDCCNLRMQPTLF